MKNTPNRSQTSRSYLHNRARQLMGAPTHKEARNGTANETQTQKTHQSAPLNTPTALGTASASPAYVLTRIRPPYFTLRRW